MAFSFTLPVRFADVDHAGIVYYPVFFHYYHQAFEELFRERMGARGYVDMLDKDKVGLPCVHIEADFRRPLAFGDDARIDVRLARLGTKSVTLRYHVYKVGGDDAPVAQADITCAVTNLANFTSMPVPEVVRNVLEILDSAAESSP